MSRLLTAAVAVLVVSACGNAASDTQAPDTKIAVKDFTFAPDAVAVDAGSTTVWTNRDDVLHTVTSGSTTGAENKADGEFSGQLEDEGAVFAFTFDVPGTYTYFCSQHNVMNGVVRVREGGTT